MHIVDDKDRFSYYPEYDALFDKYGRHYLLDDHYDCMELCNFINEQDKKVTSLEMELDFYRRKYEELIKEG